jgi:uncharacterized protein (UPF0332 family)
MSINEEQIQAIVSHRIEKSDATYTDVLKSMEFEMYSTAANRLYYSFYYAASALLLSKGVETHRHSSLQSMMHLHFVKTGLMTSEDGLLMRQLFNLRQESDYDDFVVVTKEDIEPLVIKTKGLIDKIKSLV